MSDQGEWFMNKLIGMRWKQIVALCFVSLALPVTAGEQPVEKEPMIIAIGWSSADVRYMSRHVAEWEKRPFTGSVMNVSWPSIEAGSVEMASGKGNVGWNLFGKERFTHEMVRTNVRDLHSTNFTTNVDNFLWSVSWLSTGSHFNWFDDQWWESVLHNAELYARLAHQGGLRGLFLDFEEYGHAFWSYGGEREAYALKHKEDYQGKSWETVRQQCFQRGRDFIRAINKGYPGCTIWTCFAYSHIVYRLSASETSLEDKGNGLLAAFFDGMLDGSDRKTIFIDGCEGSYRFNTPGEFKELRDVVTKDALRFTMVPEVYQKKVQVGFGLYLDMYNYPNSQLWSEGRPQDNYMPPQELESRIRQAVRISDGYVWIYSEYPSWWLAGPDDAFGAGVRARTDHRWVDPVYWDAIRRAQTVPAEVAEAQSVSNIALGRRVNGALESTLTDGDLDSRTPQVAFSFDYTVELQEAYHVRKVKLYWNGFGTNPAYIGGWELMAGLADGTSIELAAGQCPRSEKSIVLVDQEEVVTLQVRGTSSKNWICMAELAAFE